VILASNAVPEKTAIIHFSKELSPQYSTVQITPTTMAAILWILKTCVVKVKFANLTMTKMTELARKRLRSMWTTPKPVKSAWKL
jgi:hypothetical protein